MIVLSCGHKVNDMDLAHNVIIKDTGRDSSKAIGYAVVCDPCRIGYEQLGELFGTDTQAQAWLEHEEW